MKEEKQTLVLDFFAGRNDKPIARTPEGKVCLLNFERCKRNKVYVHVGEQWRCEVDSEEEKKIIVTPIHMTLDAEEMGYFVKEEAKLLKGKFDKVTIK